MSSNEQRRRWLSRQQLSVSQHQDARWKAPDFGTFPPVVRFRVRRGRCAVKTQRCSQLQPAISVTSRITTPTNPKWSPFMRNQPAGPYHLRPSRLSPIRGVIAGKSLQRRVAGSAVLPFSTPRPYRFAACKRSGWRAQCRAARSRCSSSASRFWWILTGSHVAVF